MQYDARWRLLHGWKSVLPRARLSPIYLLLTCPPLRGVYQIAVDMSASTSHLPLLLILSHAPLPAWLLTSSTTRGYMLTTNWGRAVLFSTGGCHGNDQYGDEDPSTEGATLDMDFSPFCDFACVSLRIQSHSAWRIFKQVDMLGTLWMMPVLIWIEDIEHIFNCDLLRNA